MLKAISLIGITLTTLVIGNILYYFSGIFKKIGITTLDEINDSDLEVSDEGELVENFPDEIFEAKEMNIAKAIGRISFIIAGSTLWMFMGLTVGYAAYFARLSELVKLIAYFFIYFFLLRMPFGIANRTINKSYEMEVMPEKLIFACLMIISYIIGINYYESIPKILKWHFILGQ